MTKEQARLIAIANIDKFDSYNLDYLIEKLSGVDSSTAVVVMNQMKSPMLGLILSIVLGIYGVDRFYKGDIGLGILKLITCGGCCIWYLIDIFNIMDDIRSMNLELLTQLLPQNDGKADFEEVK